MKLEDKIAQYWLRRAKRINRMIHYRERLKSKYGIPIVDKELEELAEKDKQMHSLMEKKYYACMFYRREEKRWYTVAKILLLLSLAICIVQLFFSWSGIFAFVVLPFYLYAMSYSHICRNAALIYTNDIATLRLTTAIEEALTPRKKSKVKVKVQATPGRSKKVRVNIKKPATKPLRGKDDKFIKKK